jgi:hypothetical protein
MGQLENLSDAALCFGGAAEIGPAAGKLKRCVQMSLWITQFSLRMIRKLRARRIGKASAYRADKEPRLDQRCQLRVQPV